MLCAAHNCQCTNTKKSSETLNNRTVTIIQLNSILLPLLDIRHFKLWHLFLCSPLDLLSIHCCCCYPYAFSLMSNITQFCLESASKSVQMKWAKLSNKRSKCRKTTHQMQEEKRRRFAVVIWIRRNCRIINTTMIKTVNGRLKSFDRNLYEIPSRRARIRMVFIHSFVFALLYVWWSNRVLWHWVWNHSQRELATRVAALAKLFT